ncbi:MAG: winged helix-turn-helix transcriptional regulator [Actinobacteria bacterium]|nr:winged helix-turn-helix transcriptional regulator [Actinomycetota bacterium]
MSRPVPDLNPRAPIPLSEQIAAWLRECIAAGDFRPAWDPLPSENQLMQTFGVSRDTVRRAVAIIVAEGLAYTVPGKGTFVRAR